MIKKIKHVVLNRPKRMVATNDDPTIGTQENPYTLEEFNWLVMTGEWPGGWVEFFGFVPWNLEDWYGSFSSSDSDCTSSEEENNPGDGDDGLGHGGNEDENGENKEEENQNGNKGNGNDGGSVGNDNNGECGDSTNLNIHYSYRINLEEKNPANVDTMIVRTQIDGNKDLFMFNGTQYECNKLEFRKVEVNYTKDNVYRPYSLEITGGTWSLFKLLVRKHGSLGEWQALYNGGDTPSDTIPCIIRTIFAPRAMKGDPISGYNSMVHSHPSGTLPSSDDRVTANLYAKQNYIYFGIVDKYSLTPKEFLPFSDSEVNAYLNP